MRSKDWSQTPLGRPEAWPQSLRTSVSICLECGFPIIIWWGPELVVLYNEEYMRIIEGQNSRSYAGSGIGSALVHELVKLHGGAIRTESEVGAGTTFVVTVPFGSSHLPAERIGAERSLASTSPRAEA